MAHRSPDSHRRTPRITRPIAFGWLAAIGMAVGCGAANSPMTAPESSAPGPQIAEEAILDALLDPPTPATHADTWRVNPTISTATRPGVRFDPVARRVGWSDAVEIVTSGRVPTEARPEAFVAAVGRHAPGITISFDPSSVRPGYHALLIAIGPPEVAPPARAPVTIVIEARRGVLEPSHRAALSALFDHLTAPTRLRLVIAGENPVVACPETGSADRWRAAVEALDPVGPSDLGAALARFEAGADRRRRPIVIARSAVPNRAGTEPIVVRPAMLRSPAVLAALVDRAATATPYLTDVRLQVDFDPRRVRRYRLVGFDGGRDTAAEGVGGTLWHGRGESVLFEVELGPDASDGALGVLTLEALGVDGDVVEMRRPLIADGPPEDAALATVAAATAERLRGAWWARAIDWPTLRQIYSTLPVDVRARPSVVTLGDIIGRAEAAGEPKDRFADHGPVEDMDPHRVPGAVR